MGQLLLEAGSGMRAVRQEEKGTSVAAAEAGKGRGSGER